MLAQEARVWLVEDEAEKQAALREVIEATGGEVIGLTTEQNPAYETLVDSSFPANVGSANVVILDNELEIRRVPSGDRIFSAGFRSGKLHGLKHGASVGVLAIGGSRDPLSEVSLSTGANFYPDREENAAATWTSLLEGQPSKPYIPSEGVIGRVAWEGTLDETIQRVLTGANGNVTILSVHSSEQIQEGQEIGEIENDREFAVVGRELPAGSMEDLVDEMSRKIYDQEETEERLVLSHSSQVVMTTDSSLIVVKHALRRNLRQRDPWGDPFWDDSSFDIVDLSKLAEIPQSYWDELGIAAPTQ